MPDGGQQLSVDDIVSAMRKALKADEEGKLTFINELGQVIGTLANIIQVAGWVIPFASTAAGIIKAAVGQQSDADPALKAIQDELTHLIKDLHNVTDHIDMEDITTRLNDVQVTLDLLKLHGKSDPNVVSRMPHDAIALLRDFGSQSFWTRPFFSDLMWHDGWISTDPPVDAGGEVLDPTLIMVGYMRAINMWLCTLSLMEPSGPPPELGLDITDVINNVQGYHAALAAGIHVGRVPIPDDVAIPSTIGPALLGGWSVIEPHIGAVNIYTNQPLVVDYWAWPDPELKWTIEEFDAFYDGFARFQVQFELGGKARQKALYITAGLPDFWRTLQHVRQIGGQPIERSNPNSSWSLRELDAALVRLHPLDDPDGLVTGLRVLRRLDEVANYPNDAPPPSTQLGRRSLRDAIRLATA